jgi:DNA repair protein RecN (Recombination protein N)
VDLAPLRRALGRATQARDTRYEAGEAQIARAKTEEDFLRHAVAELDKLDPKPGRGGGAGQPPPGDAGAARIREDVARALAALSDDGAEGRMRDAQRWLEGAADRAEGAARRALGGLARAMIELAEAQAGVEACLEVLEFNPASWRRRGAAVRHPGAGAQAWRRARRSGRAFARRCALRLAALDAGEAGLSRLSAAVAEAEAAYADAARRVSALRGRGGGAAGPRRWRQNWRR